VFIKLTKLTLLDPDSRTLNPLILVKSLSLKFFLSSKLLVELSNLLHIFSTISLVKSDEAL